VPSPFAAFNTRYNHLFRWDDDVFPRRENLAATVRDATNIALAQGSAVAVLERYTRAQRCLIRTIAAGVALHGSGAFALELGVCSSAEIVLTERDKVLSTFTKIYQDRALGEKLARALGLSKNEIEAVWSYTQANKEIASKGGWVNPSYMNKPFGSFKDGWEALTSALFKLPSFGSLGMTVTTCRTVRDAKELESIHRLPSGARLVLGCTPMKGGQRHVSSTAITMSKWTLPGAVKDSGGVLCYFGVSGVFINWLGQYSMGTDGEETLYPPETIMQVSGRMAKGFAGEFDIVILEEIPSFADSDLQSAAYFDDHTFARITDPRIINAARSSSRTTDLLALESFHEGNLEPGFFDV
jgi:hypothetical protein